MLITKHEEPNLISRQLEFLKETGSRLELVTTSHDSYTYKFLPGAAANHPWLVYDYLRSNVWDKSPLEIDNLSLFSYATYVGRLAYDMGCIGVDYVLGILVDMVEPTCLVHGDACIENFLYNHGVIIIDPGIPRGFSNKYNDIGKLLQNSLTFYGLQKYGIYSRDFKTYFPLVNTYSVAALVTHWVRILKNADRHNKVVQYVGKEIIIPNLIEAIRDNTRKASSVCGSRWDTSYVEGLHSRMLQEFYSYCDRQGTHHPASTDAGVGQC